MATCPAHEDDTPSLSVKRAADGRILVHCHAGCPTEAVVAAWGLDMQDLFPETKPNRNGRREHVVYDYVDERGELLFQTVRLGREKKFRQRRPARPGDPADQVKDGWVWSLKGVRTIPYRLPQVLAEEKAKRAVAIVEGEKDADRLTSLGIVATTNPMGAGKWKDEFSAFLKGRRVVIISDNDEVGYAHAQAVARSVHVVAKSVKVLELPGVPAKGDVSDWLDAGGTVDGLRELAREAPFWSPADVEPLDRSAEFLAKATNQDTPVPEPYVDRAVVLDDFWAYAPEHKFIFRPTREMWPASSVDSRVPRVIVDDDKIKASQWLDQNRSVEQMTWLPGAPEIIEDQIVSHGGFIDRPGIRCFNLYRPPTIELGDLKQAGRWIDHVHRLFEAEAAHLILWLAHRVQRPHEKVNHAIVLIGPQGVGKDSIITGAIPAVGHWNTWEIGPEELMGRFNPHRKSVILRVSEARDLGDTDRYRLYEHMKTLTAAPPEVLQVDEKNVRQYMIPNVVGVVITSNHTDGIYLPADDRRHFVAATELTKDDFTAAYWSGLYRWYEDEGFSHVAAYLHSIDLSTFNPKAPPPKTAAFWQVVDAGRAPEDAELADVLDRLEWPEVITLADLIRVAVRLEGDFADWLRDRRNRRKIPHRLEEAEYVPIRNDGAQDGRWKVGGKNQMIYAKRSLSVRDRLAAAGRLVERSR